MRGMNDSPELRVESASATPEPRRLQAQPLSAQPLADYGWMMDIDQAFEGNAGHPINAGTSRRVDMPGTLSLHAQGGQPQMTVFRARAQAVDGPWRLMERHQWGSQTFVPLGQSHEGSPACILLVALGASSPDETTLKAFVVGERQAFTLRPGTWHHPLIALQERDFLVIERRGPREDCEVMHLSRPVQVWL